MNVKSILSSVSLCVLLLFPMLLLADDPKRFLPPSKSVVEQEPEHPAASRAKAGEKAAVRRAVLKIGKAVDHIAADVEEFGTVSMSSPLLTLPTPKLDFGLRITAGEYYENARTGVAGRSLAATVIQQSLGVGVQAAADLDELAAAKSITAQIAPQLAANRELETLKQKRAQLAYDAVKRKLPPDANEQQKAQNELEALNAKADILKQDSGAKDPARPHTTTENAFAATSAAGQTSSEVTVVEDTSKPLTGADGASIPGQFAKVTTTKTTASSTPSEIAPRVDPALVAAAAIDASHTAVGKAGQTFLGSELKLNDLDAIKAAESAKSLEGLMNFFHQPVEAMQFRDKIVMMGAVTVSAMPGWRTRKDWAGEVVMVNDYSFVTARREVVERMTRDPDLPEALRERLARDYRLPWKGQAITTKGGGSVGGSPNTYLPGSGEPSKQGNPWIPPHLIYNEGAQYSMQPLVSGISPLMQSDTLDLASEFKRQDQFALALAVALRQQGAKGDAKVFEQFVKNQKKDVQTRSTSATVATYSRAGGIVGFQIGPRLKALEDPASRANKSAFILERQAFPALLVYGLDAGDIYPRIYNDGRVLTVYEAKIRNTQRSYWQPLTYRYKGPADLFNPFKTWWPKIWWEPALRRDQILSRGLDLNDALYDAHDIMGHYKTGTSRERAIYNWTKETQEAGNEMTARYAGAWNDQYLPSKVLVPLGGVPLPVVPIIKKLPVVTTVQPNFQAITTPAVTAEVPKPVPAVIEIIFVGDGLEHVLGIGCRYGKEVVDFFPRDGRDGEMETHIHANVIHMKVRVKKSVGLQFELLVDSAVFGPAATNETSVVRTPVVNVVVDGQPMTSLAQTTPVSLAVLPARRPESEEAGERLDGALSTRPAKRLGQLDPDFALIPEPIPLPEPKRPRR